MNIKETKDYMLYLAGIINESQITNKLLMECSCGCGGMGGCADMDALADEAEEMAVLVNNQEGESEHEDSEDMAPQDSGVQHYMFFNNLKTIKDRVDHMLSMCPHKVDAMLKNGHDWANDHIATSKDDVEEVFNWLTAESR
jgi:hypothetical protein